MSYVVLEGLECAGKSYLVEQLGEIYKSRLVHEPYAETGKCANIREMVRGGEVTGDEATKLLVETRIEMFNKLHIYARVNSSGYLIGDRSFITNMVYQGVTDEEMERIMVENVETLKQKGFNLLPHIVVYLKVPFEVANERIQKRGILNNLDALVMEEKTYLEMQGRYERALSMLHRAHKHVKIITITHETPIKNLCELIDAHMSTVDSIIVRKFKDAVPA